MEQKIRFYIAINVPLETRFQTQTRKEIGDIKWFPLSELFANGQKKSRFYLVTAFLTQLKKWIHQRRKALKQSEKSGSESDSESNREEVKLNDTTEFQRMALLNVLKGTPKKEKVVLVKQKKPKIPKQSTMSTSEIASENKIQILKKVVNPLLNFKFDMQRILLAYDSL